MTLPLSSSAPILPVNLSTSLVLSMPPKKNLSKKKETIRTVSGGNLRRDFLFFAFKKCN